MLPALLVAAAALGAAPITNADDPLLTIAERSDFRATATHAEVMTLLQNLDERSPLLHLVEIGRTVEGRAIPLAIIADPPVRTPREAAASGKPIVLAFGNIHAGEVCGKEALLMLAREMVTAETHPSRSACVTLLVPILNGDGNDRMAPDNRPGQVGPVEGMGERPNAQGLDLNRDWVKLESPEIRAMVRVLDEWQPHVTIDTHTTNGSHHRYPLTYAAPLNPSGHEPSIAFIRDELLPAVTERLRERTGYDTFFYGDFDRAHARWSTYSADPRYGGPYRGLRGQMSILSEAYAYADYRDRVLVTLAFVREIMGYVVEHADRVQELAAAARTDVTRRGRGPQPDDIVGIRHRLAAWPEPVVVKGWEMITPERGRPRPTDILRDHTVMHLGRFEAVVSVRRPYGYLIPPGLDSVVKTLRGHGIEIEPFAGAARVETYRVRGITRAERTFQGHHVATLDVEAEMPAPRDFPPGSHLVRTAQPLGTLAVYLLEPRATDGLAAWNMVDVEVGEAFPIHRVIEPLAPD